MPYADPNIARTHQIWRGMVARCHNSKSVSYRYYGAKGIRVHAPWLESFKTFLVDVGHIPLGKSLDRIDSTGHYEPGNVRLATVKEQNNNKSDTTKITYNGRCQTITAWAAEIGISVQALFYRIRAGWPLDRALNEPLSHGRRIIQRKH